MVEFEQCIGYSTIWCRNNSCRVRQNADAVFGESDSDSPTLFIFALYTGRFRKNDGFKTTAVRTLTNTKSMQTRARVNNTNIRISVDCFDNDEFPRSRVRSSNKNRHARGRETDGLTVIHTATAGYVTVVTDRCDPARVTLASIKPFVTVRLRHDAINVCPPRKIRNFFFF